MTEPLRMLLGMNCCSVPLSRSPPLPFAHPTHRRTSRRSSPCSAWRRPRGIPSCSRRASGHLRELHVDQTSKKQNGITSWWQCGPGASASRTTQNGPPRTACVRRSVGLGNVIRARSVRVLRVQGGPVDTTRVTSGRVVLFGGTLDARTFADDARPSIPASKSSRRP